jgi:cell division protein FtsZ
MADDVLHAGVRSITDLMVVPGLINLDFADVKTIMNNMGRAMMGTGEASGENRAIECAHNAVTNPLLDDYSLDGAKGLLINITGGTDLTLHEVDKITNEIREQVHPDADVIVGSIFDDKLEGKARVSVVATGLDSHPKPTKSIVDLQITRNSAVSSMAATPAANSNSVQASLSNEDMNEEVNENSDPYMFMDGEDSDIHSETDIEDTQVMIEPEMAAEEEVEPEPITEPEISEPEMAAEEEVEPEPITEPEISEPEMAAEEEVEPEPITEPEMVSEDGAPNSIMDLINANRENSESDAPDLFSGQNIHQLDDINDTKDEEIAEESETDQDLLEIPSFLRRQSK